jgi:hypothetical protein
MNTLTPLMPSGAPVSIETDLDLARELVKEELATSTREGYGRDFRQFSRSCGARNVSPMPATPAVVAAYVAFLVRESQLRGATSGAGPSTAFNRPDSTSLTSNASSAAVNLKSSRCGCCCRASG